MCKLRLNLRQELHASPHIEPILSYPYMVMSHPYMDMWASVKFWMNLEPWYTIKLATFNPPFRLNLTHFLTTLPLQKLEQLGPALIAHPKQMQPKGLAVIIMNIRNSTSVKLKHMSVHHSWRCLEWKPWMVRINNNKYRYEWLAKSIDS